jgi:hypothetical protein
MSLDKLLAAAITYFETGAELHRVLAATKPTFTGTVPNSQQPETATKKVATKEKDTPAVTDVIATVKAEGTPKVEKPVPTPAAEPAPSETAVDYESDIRPLIRSKSLSNRDGVVKLLASFEVKSGQELTTAQYSAFLDGLKAL